MKSTWPDAHILCVISRSDYVASNGDLWIMKWKGWRR